jgi:hypothetical protein
VPFVTETLAAHVIGRFLLPIVPVNPSFASYDSYRIN